MDSLLSGQTDKFKELYKQVVEDMHFVFHDAIEMKQEDSNELVEDKKELKDSLGYWDKTNLMIKDLKSEQGIMRFYRNSFILVMKIAVSQIATKKWAKPSISGFIKAIYFSKENFFTKDQIEELDQVIENLNNEESQAASISILLGNMAISGHRDEKILSTPLSSMNQVKDNREWTLASDGLDKWSARQFGR